jgi:hypothetical protein
VGRLVAGIDDAEAENILSNALMAVRIIKTADVGRDRV